MKLPLPEALPLAVVMEISPVTVFGITIATNWVPEFETVIADEPPIVTDMGLLRLVPLMVTSEPTDPVPGENEAIVGTCENSVPIVKNSAIRPKIIFINFFNFFCFKVSQSQFTIITRNNDIRKSC